MVSRRRVFILWSFSFCSFLSTHFDDADELYYILLILPPPLHYPCLIFLFVCFVNCVGSLLFSFPLPSTPLSLSLYKQFAVTKLGRWQPGTCTPYQLFFFTSYTKIFTPLKTLIMYPPISSNRIMCMLIISSILYTHNT